MQNAVEIKGLVKEYKNVVAVNGLDLTVACRPTPGMRRLGK